MYARGQVFLKIVPVFIAGTPAFVYNLIDSFYNRLTLFLSN